MITQPSAPTAPASSPEEAIQKRRTRRNPLLTAGPGASRALLRLLCQAELSPLEMLEKMCLPPFQAHKVLDCAQFRRTLETLVSLSLSRRRVMHARAALTAIARLTALAEGDGETARRACVDLLSLRELPAIAAEEAALEAPAATGEQMAPLEQRIDDLLNRLAEEQDRSLPAPDEPQNAATAAEPAAHEVSS